MAYWVQESSTKQNMTNYKSYKCDYRSDINKLPRFGIKGELQKDDTSSAYPCSYGSECVCIEDGSIWNLGKDTNEWVEIKKDLQNTSIIQGTPGKDGENGVGIQDISKTNTNGLIDTYTITLSNSKTFNFAVTNGKNGKDGITPTINIGENGNWIINNVDIGVSAKGDKGEPGAGFQVNQLYNSVEDMINDTDPVEDSSVVIVLTENSGNLYLRLSDYIDPNGITNGYLPMGGIADVTVVKGEKGDNGITPHIDLETKHWFIGNMDTGIKAEGENGKDGLADDINIDEELSNTSENPVQNKIVKKAIDDTNTRIKENTDNIIKAKEKLDLIKLYQKYLNTELDYCYIKPKFDSGDKNTPSTYRCGIKQGQLIPLMIENVSGEFTLSDDNTTITLKGGKTYKISMDLRLNSEKCGIFQLINVSSNELILQQTIYTVCDNIEWASENSPECIYTPLNDCKISLKCMQLNSTSSSKLYVFESFIIIEEINRSITIDPLEHVSEKSGIEDTPVGNIISHMGINPPKHYLNCNGNKYNIADYPYLAQHFKDEFGSVNHFGGDGEVTFAVPDLRGEFLRGAGTAERNTGTGESVGEHQDATPIRNITISSDNTIDTFVDHYGYAYQTENQGTDFSDKHVTESVHSIRFGARDVFTIETNRVAKYTTRPTNTSVLYCIKYEPTYYFKSIRSTVEVIENTDDVFRLKFIDNKGNEEETPNLIGKQGKQGSQGEKGKRGNDVIVEEVETHENNTYKLKFKDIDKEVVTPNLKGMDGTTADVYSLEETHIGTWIDSKPVYRKVILWNPINFQVSSSFTETIIPHGIMDIGTVLSVRVIRYTENDNLTWLMSPYLNNQISNIGSVSFNRVTPDGIHVRAVHTAWASEYPFTIILEYTKVNDTPKILRPVTFPIGYIYMSVDSQNPGKIFGGEWVSFGQGKMPIGVDPEDEDFNEVEKTGGEKYHSLTVDEIPAHSHEFYRVKMSYTETTDNNEVISPPASSTNRDMGVYTSTSSTGSGLSHNNMQPYITVYMWKRIS